MKRLLLILLLTFSFQSLAKTDDIRDFEIEGMSIGDSLLDYFSEEEINKKKFYYKQAGENKKYAMFNLNVSKTYDKVNVGFNDTDPKFKIILATGYIWFANDINNCLEKKEEIVNDIKSIFSNLEKEDYGKSEHFLDNKSYTYNTYFLFPGKYPQNHILVACYDWSEDLKYKDHLRVGIVTSEYSKWLNELN